MLRGESLVIDSFTNGDVDSQKFQFFTRNNTEFLHT